MKTSSPGGSADLELIQGHTGRPVCLPGVLPPPALLLPYRALLGTDVFAHSWARGLRKYAFPPVRLLVQKLCKIREDREQVLMDFLT